MRTGRSLMPKLYVWNKQYSEVKRTQNMFNHVADKVETGSSSLRAQRMWKRACKEPAQGRKYESRHMGQTCRYMANKSEVSVEPPQNQCRSKRVGQRVREHSRKATVTPRARDALMWQYHQKYRPIISEFGVACNVWSQTQTEIVAD